MTEFVLREIPVSGPAAPVRPRRRVAEAPTAARVALYVFIATLPFESIPIADFLAGRFSLARIAGYTFFLIALLNAGTVLRMPRGAVKWFAFWIAILAVWIPFQESDLRGASLRHVTQLVQMVILMWTASNVLRSNRAWRTALVVLVCSCALLAVYMTLVPPQYGEDRSTALGENPNTIGALFAIALVASIGLMGQLTKGVARLVFIPLAVLMLMQLVGTGSRAAIAALLAGILMMMLRSRGIGGKAKAMMLALPILAAIAYVAVTSEAMRTRLSQAINEQRFARREYIVPATLQMISEKPALGWGPETHLRELGYRMNRDSMDEHNLYLWVLNEGGIVAFIPFLIGALLVLRDADRGTGSGRGTVMIALVATVAMANMAHSHHNRKIMWVVLAMAVSTPYVRRVAHQRAATARPALRPVTEGTA